MAFNYVKGEVTKATSDIKSGNEHTALPKVLGGIPPKKNVEAIDKENTPKSYDKSYAAGS